MMRAEQVMVAYEHWKREESALITHEDGQLFVGDSGPDDVGLVVQLCGRDPAVLAAATTAVLEFFAEHHRNPVRGVDLNLGCPQVCAERGGWGAFLAQDDPELAVQCVRAMRKAMDQYVQKDDSCLSSNVPPPRLSCKVRLFANDQATLSFCRALQEAGCQTLAVHCRRIADQHQGAADWNMARNIVHHLDIPVIVNGGIQTPEDIRAVLLATGASAVMVGQGFLSNPRLLLQEDRGMDPAAVAADYLSHVEQHPPTSSLFLQRHMRWFFRSALQPPTKHTEEFQDWKARLWTFMAQPYLQTLEQFQQIVVLYAQLSGGAIPTSLRHKTAPAPTFTSIRHSREETDEREGDHGLVGLFDCE
jgi:tRNA-dihydrouridine synthase